MDNKQNVQALRELVARHNQSVNAVALIGAAMDARVAGRPLDPALDLAIGEVFAALGAPDALKGLNEKELAPILAEIRFGMLHGSKLLFHDERATSWTHAEPELLQSAGDVSAGFVPALKNNVAPRLAGLAERLDKPGASFLDVGVGVAGLAIEMARTFSSLSTVGIDVWAPSLALARQNVARAELANRIQLREQGVQDVPDIEAFDLAWFPGAFVAEQFVGPGLERIHRALRRGGWVLFAVINPAGDPLGAAIGRARTVLFGSNVLTPAQIEARLTGAGYVEVLTLPSPPNAPAAMIAGRKAP